MERNWLLARTRPALKYSFAMVLVFTACFASYAQKTKPSARKPTVLVLATSHMNNPGHDVLNVHWNDVLTEKRQKEMREFVNLLKRFKPTKIAVEVLIQTATVTAIHKFINDQEEIDEGHQVYMTLLRIGKDKEYPGVDATADWYKRNLTIFSNIIRITESKDDRILVIFGAGHAKLLQQFIEDSGEYNLEKGSKYF